MSLKKKKIKNDITDLLASDIRTGVFSHGSWLKQIDLQARYQANRSEVRKALETLSNKRIIRYEENRGYYVHHADGAATDEIRDIRILLETAAADLMVRHVCEDQLMELKQLAQRFMDEIRSETIVALYETNLAFHNALLATTGNESLVDLISELRLRTPPAPASQWNSYVRIEQSGREHFEMVEALENKDAERLKAVIHAHISQPDNTD